MTRSCAATSIRRTMVFNVGPSSTAVRTETWLGTRVRARDSQSHACSRRQSFVTHAPRSGPGSNFGQGSSTTATKVKKPPDASAKFAAAEQTAVSVRRPSSTARIRAAPTSGAASTASVQPVPSMRRPTRTDGVVIAEQWRVCPRAVRAGFDNESACVSARARSGPAPRQARRSAHLGWPGAHRDRQTEDLIIRRA